MNVSLTKSFIKTFPTNQNMKRYLTKPSTIKGKKIHSFLKFFVWEILTNHFIYMVRKLNIVYGEQVMGYNRSYLVMMVEYSGVID